MVQKTCGVPGALYLICGRPDWHGVPGIPVMNITKIIPKDYA
jgi:hypothetical protein